MTAPSLEASFNSPPERPGLHPGALLLLVAAGGWILLVTVLPQVVAWLMDNDSLSGGPGIPGWSWLLVSWGSGLLLALVVVPLALLTREPRLRAVYRTWALATLCVFILAGARLFPITQTQAATAAQALLALLCTGLLLILLRSPGAQIVPGVRRIPAALVVATAVTIPALAWGALGSPLDSLLGLAAGLSFGLLAGILLSRSLFARLLRTEHESPALPAANRNLAIFGAGTALFILGGGFGIHGCQFLFLIVLPPLAIAAGGLQLGPGPGASQVASSSEQEVPPRGSRPQQSLSALNWLPLTVLTGLVSASFLMFWDPEELATLLGAGETVDWAVRAAVASWVIALVAGLLLWASHRQLNSRAWAVAIPIACAAAGLAYVAAGKPGFYGDRFFVILRDQPDVRSAYQIPDRNDRLRYVYATLTQHATTTQAHLRSILDQRRVSYRPYYLVNALEVDGGPLLRAYLARQPEVDRIIDSQFLRPLPAPQPADKGNLPAPPDIPWNIKSIGADRVWRELGITGRGIVVGQSDSGVSGEHPALRETYRGRGGHDDYNWLDLWSGTRHPTDLGGHGTHTLGTAVGRGGIGVAPDAQWMACINLARNLGNPGAYLNCMQFMLAPYPQGGDPFRDGDPTRAPHVLNNSWGCPPIEGCDANALRPAAGALRAAGIFVVASAGNSGPACGTVSDPIALYGDVLSVGSVDQGGQVSFFSSRGPVTADGSDRTKPDIMAPGEEIISAFPDNSYMSLSGTSMSGPHVAGVVALMWSAQPRLIGNIDRTTQILLDTARPYTGALDACAGPGRVNNDAGYGVVDAYAAVKAALQEK